MRRFRAFRLPGPVSAAAAVVALLGALAGCGTPAPPAKPAAADVVPVATLDAAIEPVFARACYPCHSEARRDPWFAKLAPSSWSLDGARATLDFSRWGRYDAETRATATSMIADSVARGHMPPADYTFFNHGARLAARDKEAIAAWAASAAPAH
jgi:cytochrome c